MAVFSELGRGPTTTPHHVPAHFFQVEVLKAWKGKSHIVHSAIAAWRGARAYEPSDHDCAGEDEEQVGRGCVLVTPLLDGRINILGVTEKDKIDPDSRRNSIWGGLLV